MNNNILHLTFGPLGDQSSHLARLFRALPILQSRFNITIINLTGVTDTESTRGKFPNIEFLSYDLELNGWEIRNMLEFQLFLLEIVKKHRIDLVILQMEVWDLMRELPAILPSGVYMCTEIHAMPFLGSPITPSSNFSIDVKKKLKEISVDYRATYISNHYIEAADVLNSHVIISSSKSVNNYLLNYFPNLETNLLKSHVKRDNTLSNKQKEFEFDCIYMARMEEGKGLEYLEDIINHLSRLLKRRVRVCVLGRTDDNISELILRYLEDKSYIEYAGWADETTKHNYMTKSAVFIYPSVYDNNPIVVHEARSFGLPCVLWDLPYSHASFDERSGVIRVKYPDTGAFSNSILYALKNREPLSKNAIVFEQSGKNTLELANEYTDIYISIINSIDNNDKFK